MPSSSFVSLYLRVFNARFRLTSLEFGSAHCAVVGLYGLEPSTSRLSGVRSSHLSYRPVFSQVFQFVHLSRSFNLDGGDEGIRTLDPLLAGQVLSQLSYTPILLGLSLRTQLNPDN